MKHDNKRWEKFCFSDVFVIRNGFYNKKPECSGEGTIPFLGAVDNNNGVTEYYTLEEIDSASKTGDPPNVPLDKKIFPPNAVCVTNNGSVGYAYFQNKEFTCSHDVNALYQKDGEFNEYTGLFVATVIMHDRYRWDYGRKWRPKRMVFSELRLPIMQKSNGEPVIDKNKNYSPNGYVPDWEYMEQFVKRLHYKKITTKINEKSVALNTKEWKTFGLYELFDICRGNGLSRVALDDAFDKGVNFISRQSYNNGVNSKVEILENVEPFKAGCITVPLGGEYLGTSFVQLEPFYTGAHIAVLTPKNGKMSLLSKLFICTLIRFESKIKYCAFGRELDIHIDEEFTIKLPVIDSKKGKKEPDWKWIDNYMKSLPYSDRL